VKEIKTAESSNSFFSVDKSNIILETVKKAEDSNDIIVRFYESHGSRGKFTFFSSLPIKKFTLCNLLEEPIGESTNWNNGKVILSAKPFQIISAKLNFK